MEGKEGHEFVTEPSKNGEKKPEDALPPSRAYAEASALNLTDCSNITPSSDTNTWKSP